MDLDLDHLRSWIGNSETISEGLTPQLVARFNATVGCEAPIEAGYSAPLMIHFALHSLAPPSTGLVRTAIRRRASRHLLPCPAACGPVAKLNSRPH